MCFHHGDAIRGRGPVASIPHSQGCATSTLWVSNIFNSLCDSFRYLRRYPGAVHASGSLSTIPLFHHTADFLVITEAAFDVFRCIVRTAPAEHPDSRNLLGNIQGDYYGLGQIVFQDPSVERFCLSFGGWIPIEDKASSSIRTEKTCFSSGRLPIRRRVVHRN